MCDFLRQRRLESTSTPTNSSSSAMSSSVGSSIVYNEQRNSSNPGPLNNTHLHSSGHKRSSRDQPSTVHKRLHVAPETSTVSQVRNLLYEIHVYLMKTLLQPNYFLCSPQLLLLITMTQIPSLL